MTAQETIAYQNPSNYLGPTAEKPLGTLGGKITTLLTAVLKTRKQLWLMAQRNVVW